MKKSKVVKEIAGVILDYLKKHKMEDMLPEVISYLKEREKSDIATVYSARELTSDEKLKVKGLFEKLINQIPERINYSKDETLIDGLLISYKDKLWDFSIAGQIKEINKS
jgi:F0F1-type ATP synthase delta subunit